MKKLPAGFFAAALALILTGCGGMMDRGGWGSDSSGYPESGSAAGPGSPAGSGSPDPAPYDGSGGTLGQPLD